MSRWGMFIVLEGIDGAGTTTQARLLAEWFRKKALPLHLTAEPSGGEIGLLIRAWLKRESLPDPERHYHALALLFAADRLDHLAREIEPRLKEGIHVISDRYLLSSLAYQSLDCDPEWVKAINREAPVPAVTFLLDLPVEAALERIRQRGLFSSRELYENGVQLEKIRARYLKAVEEFYPEQEIFVINALPPAAEVHSQIISRLEPLLRERTVQLED